MKRTILLIMTLLVISISVAMSAPKYYVDQNGNLHANSIALSSGVTTTLNAVSLTNPLAVSSGGTGTSTGKISGLIDQDVRSTATPTFSNVHLSSPLGVSNGGTGNSINAARKYLYQNTASSMYAASTSTGLPWTSCPSCEVLLFPISGNTGTIPGGSMGPNGSLSIYALYTGTTSTNAKTPRIKFGSASLYNQSLATAQSWPGFYILSNRGTETAQVTRSQNGAGFTAVGNVHQEYAVDTSVDQQVSMYATTTLETAFTTTSILGTSGTCSASFAGHGLSSGEYIQASGGGNCPTSGNPNADPALVTMLTSNIFTYPCSCVGTEAGAQPLIKRYSPIILEDVIVQIMKP